MTETIVPKRRGRPPKPKPENMQSTTPQPIELKPGEMVLGHAESKDFSGILIQNPDAFKGIEVGPKPAHPTQSLADLYAAIDAAPAEWLPSILSKVVKKSLKAGAWSDVEYLILSVRGFSK